MDALLVLVVVLHPDPAQDLHRRDLPQPLRRVARVGRRQEGHAVRPDRRRQFLTLFLLCGQPPLLGAPPVAGDPVGRGVGAQPGGGDGGYDLQGVAHRLGHQFQTVEGPDGREHVGRVGPLPTAGPEQPALAETLQERVQQEAFRAAGEQAGAELAEDRGVEARVGQLQRQGVLPVDAAAGGVRRLPIREVLGELEDGHQGEPPGRRGRLTARGEEVGEGRVLVDRAEFVAHAHERMPFGEGRPRDAGGFVGDGRHGTGLQGHGRAPGRREADGRATILPAPGPPLPIPGIRQQYQVRGRASMPWRVSNQQAPRSEVQRTPRALMLAPSQGPEIHFEGFCNTL
jgi:hypothetical protein